MPSGVIERRFAVGDIDGILWTPPSGVPDTPRPLVLLGHPGDLDAMRPRLLARAARCAADGFAAAAIELPGSGARPRLSALEEARAELRGAVAGGSPVSADVINRLVLPLADTAVPEWQRALDHLQALPEIGERVAYSGGVLAIGIRMALREPRIRALSLYAGTFIPRATFDEAREVSIPAHMLLQWDDAMNDRQASLELFDALGSAEKTLNANTGGHTGVPAHASEDAAQFLSRHLRVAAGTSSV